MPPTITSTRNSRVKAAQKLRDRRQRDKQGRIIIDGVREIGRAMDAGVTFVEFFVCRPLCAGDASRALLKRAEQTGAEVLDVSPEVFQRVAFGERAEGIVAVAQTPRHQLDDLELGPHPFVAVLEAIEKPGNLGAVLRTADAAGVAAVVLADAATDLYNPNAIRGSLGAVFTLPVCAASSAGTLAWLRDNKWNMFAARVDGASAHTDADFRGGAAIVLGSESRGLSEMWRGDDITAVTLPMLGAVDSLNISAAAAVLFYEALRQRRATS